MDVGESADAAGGEQETTAAPDADVTPDVPKVETDDGTSDSGGACGTIGILTLGETVEGDTTAAPHTLALASACGSVDEPLGAGAPDNAWKFVAPEVGNYNFVLDAGFDAAIYVLSGCGEQVVCLDADDGVGTGLEGALVKLDKKQVVYVVVDGGGGAVAGGAYELKASGECTPVCYDAECGDDGCGGSCGKCDDDEACDDGECVTASKQCDPAASLKCGGSVGPLLLGDPQQSTTVFSEFPGCWGSGYTGSEIVLQFQSPTDTTVSLSGFYDQVAFVLEDAGDGCEVGLSCLAEVGSYSGQFDAEGGQTYYLVFEAYDDYWAYESSFYVDADCCAPKCAGKQCGDDGCGGSCGYCGSDEMCDSGGTCAELPSTCAPVELLGCGGSTGALALNDPDQATAAFDDFPGCYVANGSSPEVVVTFATDEAAQVTVSGFTGYAYVLEDDGGGCAEGLSCIAAMDGYYGSDQFDAEAGRTYQLVFENGYYSYDTSFSVTADCCIKSCEGKECGSDGCGGTCGKCEQGYCAAGTCKDLPDTCNPDGTLACGDQPLVLAEQVPSSMAFSKTSCGNDSYDDYGGSPEVVRQFISEVDQRVTVTLQYYYYGSGTVAVFEDTGGGCVDTGANCLTSSEYAVVFDAVAGGVYYLVWDGFGEDISALGDLQYDLTCCEKACVPSACNVPDGCGGTCGCGDGEKCSKSSECVTLEPGDTCEDPLPIEAGQTVEGDTSWSGSDVTADVAQCSMLYYSSGAGANEVVYTFTAPEAAVYQFTLIAPFSATAYLADTCEAGAAKCVASGATDYYYGDTATFAANLDEGQSAYVVVDGQYSSSVGKFTLAVSEPCYPQCDGEVCEVSDGCGSSCECDDSLACIYNQCQVPPPGDTCADPILLDAADLPIQVSGDTDAGFTDQFGQSCAAWGSGEPDVVYQFTPFESGTYQFGLAFNDLDPTVVTVIEGCEEITACLGTIDLYPVSGDSMDVELEAGVTYTVIVDSYAGESGAYMLFINPP